VRPKQASGSKYVRPKGENVKIGREDQKRGKVDLGGVWMMVNIQASVSGSNFLSILQIYTCFGCVVINHQKGGDCSEHGPICH
jgi:hypothetical protein